jgi:hypothetical protein
MKSRYHIDASRISLEELKKDLLEREMIPSRRPLKVNLEMNLLHLESQGISSMGELVSALKDKKKIPELSRITGISEDYLVLLRREVNSYFPNPVPIAKFPRISSEDIERLSTLGVNNSKQLFEYTASADNPNDLSSTTGVGVDELHRLIGMADLVRIYGVGPVFSGMLYDTGIRSLDDFLFYKPEEIIDLYQNITDKKADFSVNDLKFSQRMAAYLVDER